MARCETWSFLPLCNFTVRGCGYFATADVHMTDLKFWPMDFQARIYRLFLLYIRYPFTRKQKMSESSLFSKILRKIVACICVSQFVCMCVHDARQEDMDSARLCFHACVRAHLTACPCLRGLCIFNSNGGQMSRGRTRRGLRTSLSEI